MKLLTSNRLSLNYTFCMLLTGILMMNLTTLRAQDTNEAVVENAASESFVTGKIVDKNTNQSIGGVAVLLEGTDVGTITDQEGVYRLGPAAAGSYTLTLVKGGFIETNITDFVILENETVEFSFALSTRPIEMSDEVYELQDFTVSVSEANDMMAKMDLRMSSSEALEVLSSEDFSKFVASDVADAVKRVTGVTVQEGGFAVIRGLDERYSSTLFNGAPLPSPDPEKQSVPLDLFPSEIVSNLVVSKTFSPGLPGNSTGGSIQINSVSFPEEQGIYADFSVKTGFNTNAEDKFYGDGDRTTVDINFSDLGSTSNEIIAEDFNNLSGRLTPALEDAKMDRSVKFKMSSVMERTRFFTSLSKSEKYRSIIGEEEKRKGVPGFVNFMGTIFSSGDLALGTLTNTSGNYDTISSVFEDRTTLYLTAERDLSSEGNHTIGVVGFKNSEDKVGNRVFTNGTFENYDPNRNGVLDEGDLLGTGAAAPGQYKNGLVEAFYTSNIIQKDFDDFLDSSLYKLGMFEERRDLEVTQIYGTHSFDEIGINQIPLFKKIDTLSLDWILSDSSASQKESGVVNVAGFRLPDGNYITGGDTEESINEFTTPSVSWRLTKETQNFGRINFDINKESSVSWNFGFTQEKSTRESKQEYYPLGNRFVEYQDIGNTSQSYSTPEGASNHTYGTRPTRSVSAWPQLSGSVDPAAHATSSREISDYFLSGKFSFFENLELKLGAQYEKILMETQTIPGASGDNFFNSDLLRKGSVFDASSPAFTNYQILGYDDALEMDFNEMIDENHVLPSVILNYRPKSGIRILAAYSETVTRPSFREYTYLTAQDPLTGDFFTGNPLLETSKSVNLDLRAEYFNDDGDMFAVGIFDKCISSPLERTVLSGSNATADILFNNPNDATVRGVEFEGSKQLDFLELPLLQNLSLGFNVALIKSEVKVMDSIRAVHEEGFERSDGVTIGGDFYADAANGTSTGFETKRSLVYQPDWIYNVYATYDRPEWGTTATLSVFSQSDMLMTTSFITGGNITPDRYMASFKEVNFSLTQELNDYFTLSFSASNLLNSRREIIYDKDMFPDLKPERSLTLGRSFSLSLSASF